MEYKNSQYLNAFPSYLENPTLKPRRLYHTGFDKSIEKIVLDEPEEAKSLTHKTESIFSNKSKTLKATIKSLFNEINTRENLDSFLLYRVNEDICRQHTYFENLKTLFRFNYSPELLQDLHSKKIKIEDAVLGLEKEKRKEYLECWKDLTLLKKDLLVALKDYWLLSKREQPNQENDRHREDMQKIEAYSWQGS